MIELERKRMLIERCLTAMIGCCILAYLGMFFLLNLTGFERFCNGDMYADTLLSKIMWEEKSLFPSNWIFGNQYYVVATPVLAALIYGVTGSVNLAMVMATEIMTLLILISFFWLTTAFTKNPLHALLGCLLLISSVIAPDGPYTINVQIFFVQASYYACYLITMFVVFGDYVRAFQSDRPRIWTLILCILLSFATGMHSLRQTLVMVLPILACELFLALRRVIQKQKPWDTETRRSLIRAVCYAAANIAGVVTIEIINPPHTFQAGSMELASSGMMRERFADIGTALKEVTALNFALDRNYSPWFCVFCFFLISLVIAVAILWLVRIRRPESGLELCWLLCAVGVLGVLLAFLLFQLGMKFIYIFMWYPLVAFSGMIVLKKLPFTPKCMTVILSCVLSLGCLYHGYVPYLAMAVGGGPTDGELLCEWAMDEGYEYVYGNWLTSPRVAVYSDGEMEAAFWWEVYETTPYIVPTDIYGEEENKKAIYVFTPDEEAAGIQLAQERGVSLTKVAEFGDYLAYTSPVPLMEIPAPASEAASS